MRLSTRSVAAAATTVLAVGLTACERARPPVPRADTTRAAPTESVHVAVPPPPPPAWDTVAAGPALFVRGTSPASALVVFPQYADSTLPDSVHFDDSAFRGATLELLNRSGVSGRARVAAIGGTDWTRPQANCTEWPSARVQPVSGGAPPASWTVAFVKGRVQPVPLDSIEALPRPDSARLAADVTRLASALPNDTARAFRGIPFAVRRAYRFAVPGAEALAADVVRTLNQEAAPLEQHTLLIAERDSADTQGRYRAVYHERRAGAEEAVESTDVLAAVRFSQARRLALVLAREGAEASAYTLLERHAPGRWRVRWTSARAC